MSEKPNLFDLFGGTREMARLLDEAPSTVQGWKSAARIPAQRQPAVLAKAQELGLPVTAEDIIFPMGLGDDDQPSVLATGDDNGPGEVADSPFSEAEAATAVSLPTCSRTIAPSPLPAASPTSSSSPEADAA